MRVLLDESLPRQLKGHLRGHEVVTVQERGWAGKTNGELLSLARGEFDAFLTADQNLEHQENLREDDVPIVILSARTNRMDDLMPLIRGTLEALEEISPGRVVRLHANND